MPGGHAYPGEGSMHAQGCWRGQAYHEGHVCLGCVHAWGERV